MNDCGCTITQLSKKISKNQHYICGSIKSAAGSVPLIKTSLTPKDIFGTIKARLSINRMNYSIEPGLYAAGNPTDQSPVIVSANYKLTFDHLRTMIKDTSVWVLILDTKGINVWCAAGKGTFGTKELISKIFETRLDKIVSHKNIILPQLGAVGVSAHLVTKQTGFKVIYGPVSAVEIKHFIDNGMKKNEKMSKISFNILERIVLIPVELSVVIKYIPVMILTGFISGFIRDGSITIHAFLDSIFLITGVISGSVLVPILLPYIPGKPFSVKGAQIGFIISASLALYTGIQPIIAVPLIIAASAISAYLSLQFTGATTFTSESAVKKEVRYSLPIIYFAIAAAIGIRISEFIILKLTAGVNL